MRKIERADLTPGLMYYLADPDVPEEEVADHPHTEIARFKYNIPSGRSLFRVKGGVRNEEFSDQWYAFWEIPQVDPFGHD